MTDRYFTGWHLRKDRVREVLDQFLSDEDRTAMYISRFLTKDLVAKLDSQVYFKNGQSLTIKPDRDIEAVDKTDMDKFLGEWRQEQQ